MCMHWVCVWVYVSVCCGCVLFVCVMYMCCVCAHIQLCVCAHVHVICTYMCVLVYECIIFAELRITI